ncbi:MAG: hypothetical protein DRI97_10160 [Bacteroidetes bacterium]|nr:MAG: hypothetical protein DRI97_10160 [Bacteroidota bacterium]RLD73027.1 MAG: hypothetical protein DRI98_00160 [Bacteroidota bacterium]RLD95373.1 MAG: hypothetical protein DRJ29_03140 [Bacteroidota bacterium]
MKIFKFLSVLTFIVVMVSCSSIEVVVDPKNNTDFSKYETYSFLGWQNNSDEILEDTDRKAMRDAFTSEFERRGLKRVKFKGDIQISLYIIVSEVGSVSGIATHYSNANSIYTHYGYGYGYSTSTMKQKSSEVGTMIMDVFDGQSKKQVWQAIAKKTITQDLDKRAKNMQTNIRAIMRDFPVKAK